MSSHHPPNNNPKRIAFTAAMALEILAGTKTQTRRASKTKPGATTVSRCIYTPGQRLLVAEWHSRCKGCGTMNFAGASGVRHPTCSQCGYPLKRWAPPMLHRSVDCRAEIQVTDVRTERLHCLSEMDAQAEGFSSRDDFRRAWDQINWTGAWLANPLVHVITFRRMKP